MKRPNFLFIITDQQRADHVGFGGNEIVQTPNLDGLAQEGTQFERAYVPNPICGPCRRSILTGRMPSMHGGWNNGIALDWDANTFVRVLRQHDYRTGLIGKSHIQEMIEGPPPDAGDDHPTLFAPGGVGEAVNPRREAGWDLWERIRRHRQEWVDVPQDFYGFDHVDLVCGHQDLPSGHYFHWVKEQGADVHKIGEPRNALRRYEGWNQVFQSSVPEELFPTSYITQRTIEFLQEAQEDERPFFLFASYPDPHHPFAAPGRYYDMYDPQSIPLPSTLYDTHEDSMPHFKNMIANRGKDSHGPFPFSISAEQLRHATAVEYGTITMIDEGVGEILATLERLGLDDSTIVVFTSDHGDMFGDHGIMLKHATHYEGVVRVPLVIKTPETDAGQCNSLVSLLDLGQTVLDLADCPEYNGMQGHSLRPLIEDPSDSVRDAVLIEEDMPVDVMGQGHSYCLRTLVTEDARLTLYAGSDHGELFDLKNDPDEMTNLFARPEGQELRADMMQRLAYAMMEHTNFGT